MITKEQRESRDPKVDPAPGDVLCSPTGACLIRVDSADGERVAFHHRELGYPDMPSTLPLDEWRAYTKRSVVLTLAERIAGLEEQRHAYEKRIAEITAEIDFFRREAPR